MHWRCLLLTGLLLSGQIIAQSQLYLRSRTIHTNTEASTLAPPQLERQAKNGRNIAGRQHLLVQLDVPDTPEASKSETIRATLDRLTENGAAVLGYVPDHGFVISAPLSVDLEVSGVKWAGPILASDKMESVAMGDLAATEAGGSYFVVEFFADVATDEARDIISSAGPTIREHPDLLRNQLLVEATIEQVEQLAEFDSVAFILPAIEELVTGKPVVACLGATTEFGPLSPIAAATANEGWDGPGKGSAALTYKFNTLTSKIPAGQIREELVKALTEWSRNARITFSETVRSDQLKSIDILFATGQHNDPYAFDGRGSVLAHTFYPSPPNPEPIAGDMHFDDDELWTVGGALDLYSTALHELGHALGLGHLNSTSAVMYPYYRKVTKLGSPDIEALQAIYAAPGSTAPDPAPVDPPQSPSNPTIRILSPAGNPITVTGATLQISGTATHASGISSVTWRNDRGASGTAFFLNPAATDWMLTASGLASGDNDVTITARAKNGATASTAIRLTLVSANGGADRTAPVLSITFPGMTSYSTAASEIRITGTARDNVGVASITWETPTNRGAAIGTQNWSTPSIPLLTGMNNIVIRAYDAAGNSSWRTVVVNRR